MAKERILVVEDEDDIRELLQYNLSKEGYAVSFAATGEDGLKQARATLPDLVLLDLMLPKMDGLEVCRTLRGDERTRQIPIIMITAKGEDADVVTGLEVGADDYIPKPFSPRVVVARVRNLLRRRAKESTVDAQAPIKAGEILIHPGRREVLVKGKDVVLTFTEFGILSLLARRPGWVFTREQIVDAVRGEDYAVTERAVDVQIVGLRKKLGAHGKLVETVRGVGYRFKD